MSDFINGVETDKFELIVRVPDSEFGLITRFYAYVGNTAYDYSFNAISVKPETPESKVERNLNKFGLRNRSKLIDSLGETNLCENAFISFLETDLSWNEYPHEIQIYDGPQLAINLKPYNYMEDDVGNNFTIPSKH